MLKWQITDNSAPDIFTGGFLKDVVLQDIRTQYMLRWFVSALFAIQLNRENDGWECFGLGLFPHRQFHLWKLQQLTCELKVVNVQLGRYYQNWKLTVWGTRLFSVRKKFLFKVKCIIRSYSAQLVSLCPMRKIITCMKMSHNTTQRNCNLITWT